MSCSSRNFSFSIFNVRYELTESAACSTRTVGKSTRYFNGSTKKDSVVRSEFNPGLLCSVASKAVEAMIATSRRVLIDGPVANKSFIADASYQLKVLRLEFIQKSQPNKTI